MGSSFKASIWEQSGAFLKQIRQEIMSEENDRLSATLCRTKAHRKMRHSTGSIRCHFTPDNQPISGPGSMLMIAGGFMISVMTIYASFG